MVFRMDSGNASCLCIRDHYRPRLSTLKRVKPVKKKANDPYYRKTVCGNGQAPVKGASFVMAIVLAGCMFWDPSRFAAVTSTLEIWHGLLLMWAVCAGIIHGVGFRPESVHWQGIFCPLLADIVLIVGLIFFFL